MLKFEILLVYFGQQLKILKNLILGWLFSQIRGKMPLLVICYEKGSDFEAKINA